jgi:hypothetical protein
VQISVRTPRPRFRKGTTPLNEIPAPELLFDFSNHSLQDLQMASFDRSARNLKAAKSAWNEAVREEAIALVAAYFLEYREAMLEAARRTVEMQTVLEFPQARKRA